jgi:hypothetical protein
MNAEDIFEVHGYYEDIVIRIGDRAKLIGTRPIPKPNSRPLGVDGATEYTITEPLTLNVGFKQKTFRASIERPIRCTGYAQALCGRRKVLAGA